MSSQFVIIFVTLLFLLSKTGSDLYSDPVRKEKKKGNFVLQDFAFYLSRVFLLELELALRKLS